MNNNERLRLKKIYEEMPEEVLIKRMLEGEEGYTPGAYELLIEECKKRNILERPRIKERIEEKKMKPEDFAKLLFNGYLARIDELSAIKKLFNFEEEPEFFTQEMGVLLIFITLEFIRSKVRDKEKRDIIAICFLRCIQTRFLPEFIDDDKQIVENMRLMEDRCKEYEEALSNESGSGPMWHLSRKVINNMYGKDMLDIWRLTDFVAIYTMIYEFYGKHTANIKVV